MTISTTSNTVVAQGNGLTTSFGFGFPVPLASELFVYYTDANNNVTLLSSSQYSTTGIGTSNGGSVTYPISGSPIATGTSLTIQRIVAYQQLTDLVNQSGYYPNVVENALDYLTMQTQQLAQAVKLSLQVPLASVGANLTFPNTAARGNTLAGFDVNGNATVYPITASVGAGNMISEGPFVSGPGFTPGTTTTLTLSQAYGPATNVSVHFDGTYQGPDQYTLIGSQIIFTSPIPVGVSKVYVVGGTTLSNLLVNDANVSPSSALYNRIFNVINVMDPAYGAKLDGVHDDTVAVKLAVAAAAALGGGVVSIPRGTPLLSSPIVLSSPNIIIRGDSRLTTTVVVPNNCAGFSGYNPNAVFILNANNCGVENIGMSGNIANNSAQAFGAIANTVAVSGLFVENCYIHDFIYNGIILNPLTGVSSNFSIRRNRIENIGWGAITTYCSTNGDIESNSIVSCGAGGILTGYNSITGNFNVAQNIRINNNFVTKAVPPTHIVSGAAETGFMIAVSAGDSYITVDSNICIDNRNAASDGIGLGQDGVRLNEGLVFSNNVVVYAGLFGIDVSSNHIVSNNYIRWSAQNGIKLGTDAGGNLINATVVDNIVDSCNLAGTTQDGIYCAATLTAGIPTAIYENIKINGNRVMDFNVTPSTVYGLNIGFQNNLTYQNNEFKDNDFTQLAGVNGNAFRVSGTSANYVGWSYKGNKHPNSLPATAGATPLVMGLDSMTIVNGGATNVVNFLGGYDGQEIMVQSGNANTTYVPGSGILTHASANQAAAANSIYKFFKFGSSWYLNQFFTP